MQQRNEITHELQCLDLPPFDLLVLYPVEQDGNDQPQRVDIDVVGKLELRQSHHALPIVVMMASECSDDRVLYCGYLRVLDQLEDAAEGPNGFFFDLLLGVVDQLG